MTDRRLVLVVAETSHIQSYIFASNRLKENVGASYLVAAATGRWALETLEALNIRHNVLAAENNQEAYDDGLRIEAGELDAEVLYTGGGNIVLLFAESDTVQGDFTENRLPADALSRQFIRLLSRRVQQEAPGLKLTFNAAPFNWDDCLSKAVGKLLQGMKQQRSRQPGLRGDIGLSVQMVDTSTNLPAVAMENYSDNGWQALSAETIAKQRAADHANDILEAALGLDGGDYFLTQDLDELGRSKDSASYIAVVHADGNGLGDLIQGLQANFPEGRNREYVEYMRWFSKGVKDVAQAAQREMADYLLRSIEVVDGHHYLVGQGDKTRDIQLKQRNGKTFFPMRPLVSGGDDVTFVCDGRIGIDLAVIFLLAFEKYATQILNRKLTACAGIAIVKSHYPFARAYELADDLASSAKQARYAHFAEPEDAPSALDWHITAGGLYGDLSAIREREYQTTYGSLTLRPLFVGDSDEDRHPYTWSMVQRILTQFQFKWDNHHNKAKDLLDVLRKGPDATMAFKLRYLSPSESSWSPGKPPCLPEVGGFEHNGWQGEYCGYYDALELIDLYIPLKGAQDE